MKQLTFITLACALSVCAQADTIDKIKSTGTVTMGVRDSSGVLSYSVGDSYTGFHVELCRKALSNLQKELNLPKLEIKYQLVTSSNRIPLLQNGTIDIECGSTTNNAARQQQVSFAVTTYVEEVRMAVRSNSGITSISQLGGKTVTTNTGSTSVQVLRKHKRAVGLDIHEMFGKDHAENMLSLESGRADAFVMDAQDLAGNIARAKNPADFKIVGEPLSVEPIAIMLRKDDAAFKRSVDNTLKGLMRSGEIAQLYDRWFIKPVPPTNASINLPASDATKTAWANPNDKPAEDYPQPQ